MKELIEKRLNLILAVLILVVAIGFGIPLATRGCSTSTSKGELETEPPTVVADATPDEVTEPSTGVKIVDATVKVKPNQAKTSSDSSASKLSEPTEDATEASTKKTETKATTPTTKKVYATAPKTDYPASHEEQWDEGYIVAIDSPDADYECGHIELTDKNRELVERLCMGEFGSGGFVGASLIAQAVKDAMYFDGFTDVQDVITNYHYTGSLEIEPSESVREAVVYIFDMDKDAVQHKILYMYNPEDLESKFSAFHESRRYVCTYENVRFFDR